MKKNLLTIFFVSLFLATFSQTTVIIGSGSTGNTTTAYPCALADSYGGQHAQYLYNSAAMSGAGIPSGALITKIGWVANATTISNHLIEGFSIKLKNTAITNVSTSSWEVGTSLVYGPQNYSYPTGTAGNIMFTLTSPFTYNGTGLLVDVCHGAATTSPTSNPALQLQTLVGYNASHTYRADNVNGCSTNLATNTGTATTRPRLVVTYVVPQACSGIPNSPVISVNGQNAICAGNSVSFTATGLSLTLNLVTQWLVANSPGGPYTLLSSNPNTFSNNYITPNLSAGTYYYVCKSICEITGTVSTSNEITVSVYPTPSITTQPLANQNICENQSTTPLSVSYTGGSPNVSYQWYYTTNGLNTGGTLVSGATNSTYTPPSSLVFNRYYYCVISFLEGCSVSSNTAQVVISTLPTISAQPTGSQTKCLGGTTTNLTVSVINGAGAPSFQWYSNSQNTYTGNIITGANSNTFTPPSGMVGTIYYYCQVSFPNGNCGSLFSSMSTVTIVADPVIDIQPLSAQTICLGGTASSINVQASAGIGILSYQWFYNTTNSTSGGVLISGATSSTYSPGNFNTVLSRYYYVVVSNSVLGCNTLVSSASQLNVISDPIPSITPASQVICTNGNYSELNAIYSGGQGSPTYQWYISSNGSNLGGTAIAGSNTSTYSPPNIGSSNSYYYCTITLSGAGCSVNTGVSVTSTNSSFQYLTQPLFSQTLCADGNTTPLTVSAINNSASSTYQWYSNTTNSYANSTPIPGANSTSYSPPSNSNGLKFYFCLANVNSISCQSNISSVLVVADPVISQQPISEQTICVGGTPSPVSVGVSGGVGTPTYQWYSSGSLDSPIPGANSATLNQGVFNTPFQNSYYATINFSVSGCNSLTSGLSNLLVVNDPTILPISNTSQTVCASNNLTNLEVVVNNGTQLSYQWFSNSINSIGNGNMIANANYANYLATAATLGNVYYYCVISSTASGCTSPQTSGVYQINTIAQPLITSEPYQTGTCLNNALPPLQISGNQDDIATYKFFKSNSNQNYDGIEIATLPFIPDNGFSGQFTYYFTYSIDYPGCTSDTSDFYQVTITDVPQLALQSTDDITGCSGAEFNLANLVQSNLQENYSIIWSLDNTIVDTINNSTNYQTLPISAGSHQIQAEIISSFDNCTVSDSVMLNLNVAPTPYIVEELNFDQNICPYDTEINLPTVILSNDYSLIIPIFEWFDSSDNTITPIAFANTNSYLPPIQNNSNYQSFCQINFGLPGCPTLETSISDILIDSMNSQCYPLFNISEAISPNNDGINDYWTINELDLFNGYAINIFNSFGQSIYQIKNTPPNWDGTWNGQTLPNGDYFYSVKLDELNRTIFGTISIAK